MSAADGIKSLERRAVAMARTRWVVYAVIAVLLLMGAYCAGSADGTRDQRLAALGARDDTVRDTIHVTEKRFVVDTQIVRVRHAADQAVRDTAQSALQDARIALQQARQRPDSTPADSAAHALANAVLPGVEACGRALKADSLDYNALHTAFVDLSVHDKAETERADIAEAKYALVKPARIGWKTGAVIGVLAAIGAHLAFK